MNLLNPHLFRNKPTYVAVSGGVDSVVLLHKVLATTSNVTIAHFYHNHSTTADAEIEFVTRLAADYNLDLFVKYQTDIKRDGDSLEAHWRRGRINFFKSLDSVVATGHNLDDAVEWYLFTCMRGGGKLMPFATENLVKPLLLVPKIDIVEYATKHQLTWIEDPTNVDLTRSRNRIRHNIVPEALKVNPGLYTTIKKQLYSQWFIEKSDND